MSCFIDAISSPRPVGDPFVAALRRGESAAYERLVREQSPRLMAVAQRYLSDADAEDAVQETLIRAFTHLDQFDGASQLSTWLHRILVNACLMQIRARGRRREHALTDVPQASTECGARHDEAPIDRLAWHEEKAAGATRVRQHVAQLPRQYREVVELRYIDGRTTLDTARALGASPGATKARLHRALKRLRSEAASDERLDHRAA